jgi:hypothetical protein
MIQKSVILELGDAPFFQFWRITHTMFIFWNTLGINRLFD